MDNTTQEFNKFTIPVRWGIIISIISVFITTIYGMFMMKSMGIMGASIVGVLTFITMMLLLLVMGTQQRKAMGGFITFREAFSAIFVSILIVVVVSSVYQYIYTHFIDPNYFETMREMSVKMSTSLGVDADKAEAASMEQIEKQKGVSSIFLGIATSLVLYSLFGFIIAAIVKRNKPEHLA